MSTMVKVIPSIIIALLCLATNEISADNQPKGITGHSNDPCELPEAKGVRLMVKTNLFNDILLTPDIGFEIGFSPHWSLSLQGECAWRSNDSRHRYWRVAGGSAEARYWIVPEGFRRTQKGHHITRVRDKNFMIFNQAKDIEYWAAFQGRLIYLYSLVLLIPEDKLPA